MAKKSQTADSPTGRVRVSRVVRQALDQERKTVRLTAGQQQHLAATK